MKLFRKKEEVSLVVKEEPVVVAVPDIKEYLVKEYERVNLLISENENLLIEIEKFKEIQMKYEATLVTLDECSKRLKITENKLSEEKQRVLGVEAKLKHCRDEINTYKIRLQDAALTKEEIKDDIVLEFKSNLVEAINTVKGNLSKSIVAKIINETELHPTEKGGVE